MNPWSQPAKSGSCCCTVQPSNGLPQTRAGRSHCIQLISLPLLVGTPWYDDDVANKPPGSAETQAVSPSVVRPSIDAHTCIHPAVHISPHSCKQTNRPGGPHACITSGDVVGKCPSASLYARYIEVRPLKSPSLRTPPPPCRRWRRAVTVQPSGAMAVTGLML